MNPVSWKWGNKDSDDEHCETAGPHLAAMANIYWVVALYQALCDIF